MFTAVIHEEKGIFVAECPEVGTASQGSTMQEALENLKKATELYLEEFPGHVRSHPYVTTFEMSHA